MVKRTVPAPDFASRGAIIWSITLADLEPFLRAQGIELADLRDGDIQRLCSIWASGEEGWTEQAATVAELFAEERDES